MLFFALEIFFRRSADLYILSSSPISLTMVFSRERESESSYMVNWDVYPIILASERRILENMEWNVPMERYRTDSSETSCDMRSLISRAALLVKVSARIFHGLTS